jgi:hypothetical protein
LNELTRKDTEWTWENRHQQAFEELKTRVTTEPILAHPILTDPFELEVDASGFAMGAVLLQKKEDGKKHPICYVFLTITVHVTDYHRDRHLYFIIHSHHTQTMTQLLPIVTHY